MPREPEERLPIKPITKESRQTFWTVIDSAAQTPTNQVIARGIEILLGAEKWWREVVERSNPYSKMPSGRMECVFCGTGNNREYREIGEFEHATDCAWKLAKELK